MRPTQKLSHIPDATQKRRFQVKQVHRRFVVFPSVLTIVSLLTVFLSPNSYASTSAARRIPSTVTTVSWKAVMSDSVAVPTSIPYVYSWAPSERLQNRYTKITNIGSVTITGFNLTVDSIDSNGTRKNVPKVTLTLCSGAVWNEATDTCAGTPIVLGILQSGNISVSYQLKSLSSVSVLLSITKTREVRWISTFNTSVTRQQVRTGVSLNS